MVILVLVRVLVERGVARVVFRYSGIKGDAGKEDGVFLLRDINRKSSGV